MKINNFIIDASVIIGILVIADTVPSMIENTLASGLLALSIIGWLLVQSVRNLETRKKYRPKIRFSPSSGLRDKNTWIVLLIWVPIFVFLWVLEFSELTLWIAYRIFMIVAAIKLSVRLLFALYMQWEWHTTLKTYLERRRQALVSFRNEPIGEFRTPFLLHATDGLNEVSVMRISNERDVYAFCSDSDSFTTEGSDDMVVKLRGLKLLSAVKVGNSPGHITIFEIWPKEKALAESGVVTLENWNNLPGNFAKKMRAWVTLHGAETLVKTHCSR